MSDAAPSRGVIDWPRRRWSQPQSRWLIHTDTWAGSRAWCTTPARSAWTESRSTASFKSGRERGHGLVGVVPGPVEPPVHGPLHPPPHRIEQGRRGQRGGGHRHRGVEPEHLGGQQHQPGVDPGQQAGDDRVGHGPGDDPVDVVQPVPQHGDADGHRDERDGPAAYRVLEVGGRVARPRSLGRHPASRPPRSRRPRRPATSAARARPSRRAGNGTPGTARRPGPWRRSAARRRPP